MNEIILSIENSPRIKKKYRAIVQHKITKVIRYIDFGASQYEQYKDSTGRGLYTQYDHMNLTRRQNYFKRFSNTPYKKNALKKEIEQSNGCYTAKILSHQYLW
jgi:hypothetical protein